MVKVNEIQKYTAQCLAECFGTFVFMLIGEASIAQYKLGRYEHHSKITINLSFGVGVYTALMIAGPVSGAHLNPALSISLMTIRKLKPVQCLFYVIGQMIGAFLGALVVYALYWNLFNEFDGGVRLVAGTNGTADIFFTMPSKGVEHWNSFFDQIVGTAVLMIFVMALGNGSNRMMSEVAKPFAFVLIILGITSAFAENAGGAINPARDLGPRLFAAFIYGWNDVFRANHCFFWIPIVGPIVGGILGVWLFEGYWFAIKRLTKVSDGMSMESVELHPKLSPMDDDDEHVIMSHRLPTVHK